MAAGLLYFASFAAVAQTPVVLTVSDENGLAVSGAQVTVSEPGRPDLALQTDYAGRCSYASRQNAPYQLRIEKPGFYQVLKSGVDAHLEEVAVVLTHEQVIQQEVNVTASTVGIDPEQTSLKSTMNTPEIVNIPYPTSRDIRNLLPFNPGVVQDASGQVHVAGSETYATLDLLDGFDIRSPLSGQLAMRVSADAVRSIDTEITRYPVSFGKATGGVIAFYTGMGDNKFRFNATDFLPSFHDVNGIRFDKFVPRFTFSGPIVKNRAWFFDGLETEYDNIYIQELPSNADTNHLIRGSNLAKAQVNITPANILSGGFLFNDYHSPYDGISSLTPQESTTKRDTVAWLPYLRDQHTFANGALLDTGFGYVRFRDGYEPRGDQPYALTPELSQGSYFENQVSHSHREEGIANLYLPPRQWLGRHDLRTGIDLDHVDFDVHVSRAPVNYLREDGTLSRRSVFPYFAPFTRHNVETGVYLQDRWLARPGLMIEPGLRFDWDEIIRRPLFSPRVAIAYAPGSNPTTKLSAGIGLYYEHTQLEYLMRALAGIRYDTYYATDGVTPVSGPLETIFQANDNLLHQTHTINWSLGIEQKLPSEIYASVNFLEKRTNNGFVYANQNGLAALSGIYLLTNQRSDHYDSVEFHARHTFASGYTLFASYMWSSAHTNAALDYLPTVSVLGPQQSGPLAWNSPNRLISWGWLPFLLPKFKKSWDFVYTAQWQSGFPFTAVNAARQVVGAAGAYHFPDYVSFSPGLEWRFHFRGAYFGLRGVLENATDSKDPGVVNNVVDSPMFGTFSEFQGRAVTGRLRLIGAK
ncbi:TonB-dependent receptor [Alloacidobacterium dinghuense]|uniref:TonB-dependent receptor n=1 Tax=Alloacidobacterium dinghuense TaxID=2763107 RepID=A0A7G8BIU4_9BACT|nr:TonB-dependent receptor [Alloacidobacterium dinghuense]QNI32464.1 TonB-dependent receptor [Alloacidobacterium dinghuense]